MAQLPCPGYAIGGVCHPGGHLYQVTGWVCALLPTHKPRYLMGVGTPQDLLECIALGVDMFDCVMPTRNARNGTLFTTQGRINIRNQRYARDFTPLDPGLPTYVSRHYTKAYLHHLVRARERLAGQVATLQNLACYLWLVRQARHHIVQGDFMPWKDRTLARVMAKL